MNETKIPNLIVLKNNQTNMPKNVIVSLLYSILLLIGITVCVICDIAISGSLTWSLIPISSILFAWVVSFPSMIKGKSGIIVSLISISVFTVPYLFLLSHLINREKVFSVGATISVVSIIFLWIIAAIFKFIGRKKKCTALGITFLTAIPFLFIINVILSRVIAEPILDVWDILSALLLLILALICFIFGYQQNGHIKK